ncbi:isoaspartyl peptidase/L-asparaginase family protein [Persicitalea jodogahamensis]|uniref:Isoaspartyl peptidase n=1 Tax=Persicitalea jodogahamensis TaxID=402147 RepID=A0A8J3D7B0_9BACT|nr:isoaspartyl peptidase/L-asparaginase [Persicitalea jodogahamensis]GHB83445.1 isoaspartyl peptidase/L-asparaginase [Persicitalea jodogahamensis]
MFTIAIHGGSCWIDPSEITDSQRTVYFNVLKEALNMGYAILANGGTSLDAVEKAVATLEDNPLFNAGRGSAFNHDGFHEMDAALMCGHTLRAGAMAGVRNVRNPIQAARAVMEKTQNVLLTGSGAETFAREQGILFEDDPYFYNHDRYQELLKAQEQMPARNVGKGTVGAVALDRAGHLAAATSTGGFPNKHYGRVGDSPIIGSGTYANDRACAVSCTGDGEYFLRAVAAYDVFCLIDYKGLSLREACATVIHDKIGKAGGKGGMIAVDCHGNAELVFNCDVLFRAWKNERGEGETAIL